MSKPVHLARKLLTEISSKDDDSPYETLYSLMEILENKIEPDSEEIYLVTEIYQLIEKFKLLEGRLKKYIENDIKKMPGNKLSELYEKDSSYGTSKIF
jgi:hypothetical protein